MDNDTDNPANVVKGALTIRDDDGGALDVIGTLDVRDRHGARRPFARSFVAEMANEQRYGNSQHYTVPAGQRLVLTHVSGSVELDAQGQFASVVRLTGWTSLRLLPEDAVRRPGRGYAQSFSHHVEVEYPPGANIWLFCERSDRVDRAACFADVIGYLVKL